jgi:hypothetical protein
MFGSGLETLEPFSLEIRVTIEPGQRWRLRAAPRVKDQILEAVRAAASRVEAFRPGRIYCYHCESADCPHSVPPRPTSVFGGYSSTGLPLWPELTSILLDLRHPEVDRIYEDPNGYLAAAHMDASLLKSRQLPVFGKLSKTYDILGQVVFGFVSLRPTGCGSSEEERVAFTLQAVEVRGLGGSFRRELNLVGRFWDGTDAVVALEGHQGGRILQVVSRGRRRLQQIGQHAGIGGISEPMALSPGVERLLKGVARSLERLGRQSSRRTVHAEARRGDNRPTSKAWEDVVSAPRERILWDVRRHTVVVVGPKNRIHVFSPQGRHVTSLLLEGDEVRGRIRRGRWRPLAREAMEQFSAAVGRKEEALLPPSEKPS